jgi:DNA-binding response OmpR family regulator
MVCNVLIVEDDPLLAWAMAVQLETIGCRVAGLVATAEEGIRSTREQRLDLVIMDIRLAGPVDGLEAARSIRMTSRVPILLCSSMAGATHVEASARAIGNCRLIDKPFAESQLCAALNELLGRSNESRAASATISLSIPSQPAGSNPGAPDKATSKVGSGEISPDRTD